MHTWTWLQHDSAYIVPAVAAFSFSVFKILGNTAQKKRLKTLIWVICSEWTHCSAVQHLLTWKPKQSRPTIPTHTYFECVTCISCFSHFTIYHTQDSLNWSCIHSKKGKLIISNTTIITAKNFCSLIGNTVRWTFQTDNTQLHHTTEEEHTTDGKMRHNFSCFAEYIQECMRSSKF